MKTFNDSKSQHLEELEALISSSLSEKELEDRLSDYHDNDIAFGLCRNIGLSMNCNFKCYCISL